MQEQSNNESSNLGPNKKGGLVSALKTPKVMVLLLIVVALGLFLVVKSSSNNDQAKKDIAATQNMAHITITKDGFVPANLVVKKGTKIEWVNTDSAIHQIQANPHPTGTSLPGLSSAILNTNQSYQYTANTSGSFGYHDHINPTVNGTLEVK